MENKIILTDEKGLRYVVDLIKAKELGVLEKEIKPLWFPKLKEKYYYCAENFMVKDCKCTDSLESKERKNKGNVYKTEEQCKLASRFLKIGVNEIILKFAIENDCLIFDRNEIMDKETIKYEIKYSRNFDCYITSEVKEYEFIPHTVLLSDPDKADKIAAYLNENKLGLCDPENFEEQESTIPVK